MDIIALIIIVLVLGVTIYLLERSFPFLNEFPTEVKSFKELNICYSIYTISYIFLALWEPSFFLDPYIFTIILLCLICLYVFITIQMIYYSNKEYKKYKFHLFFFSFYIIIGSLFIMFGLLGDVLIIFLKNLEINYLHLNYEDPIFIVLSSNYFRAQLFVSGLLSFVTGYGLYKRKKYALYLLLISLALISARNIVFIFTLQQGILERILLLLVPVFSILIAKYYLNRKNILFK